MKWNNQCIGLFTGYDISDTWANNIQHYGEFNKYNINSHFFDSTLVEYCYCSPRDRRDGWFSLNVCAFSFIFLCLNDPAILLFLSFSPFFAKISNICLH